MQLKLRALPRIWYVPLTVVAITMAILVSFLVHFIPSSAAPIGARLLPMFYVPLLAIVFVHPWVAIIASLLTPILNHLITGMPVLTMVLPLTLELFAFSLIVSFINQRWPRFYLAASVAYLIAKILSTITTAASLGGSMVDFIQDQRWQSLFIAWPGLLILLILNFMAVRIVHSAETEHE